MAHPSKYRSTRGRNRKRFPKFNRYGNRIYYKVTRGGIRL